MSDSDKDKHSRKSEAANATFAVIAGIGFAAFGVVLSSLGSITSPIDYVLPVFLLIAIAYVIFFGYVTTSRINRHEQQKFYEKIIEEQDKRMAQMIEKFEQRLKEHNDEAPYMIEDEFIDDDYLEDTDDNQRG